VTVWSPGCTVSSVSNEARLVMVIVTVTLSPALSVPDIGVTFSLPLSQAGSEIDHATGPSLAVSVSDPLCHGLTATVVGDTDSAPALSVLGGAPVADGSDQVGVGVGQSVAVAAGDAVASFAAATGDVVPSLAVAPGEVDALVAGPVLPLVAGSVVGWSVVPPGRPLLGSADGAAAGTLSLGPPPGECVGGTCGRTAVTTATAAAVTAVPPATVIGTCGRCRMFR
jgi:hypothetical protein